MKKIIVCVGSDDNYLQNIHLKNYLSSLNENSNFDTTALVYIGDKENISSGYEKIDVFNIHPDSVKKLSPIKCMQHGEFLNSESFNQFSDDDVIFFTDGDMILQRGISKEEREFLINLKENDVFVGYNASPEDTLIDEYYRLYPNEDHKDIFGSELDGVKVYNTGVLCMTKKTWRNLADMYVEKYNDIDPVLGHYAKQQWLICYIIHKYNFNVIEMGYNIHNHSHYPPSEGTVFEDGIVKYKGEVVLFKHRWF